MHIELGIQVARAWYQLKELGAIGLQNTFDGKVQVQLRDLKRMAAIPGEAKIEKFDLDGEPWVRYVKTCGHIKFVYVNKEEVRKDA